VGFQKEKGSKMDIDMLLVPVSREAMFSFGKVKGDIMARLSIILLWLMMILCMMSLGTCEYFDLSLEDYASMVIGLGYDFRTKVVSKPDGTLVIPPAGEEGVSELTVKLRNPRNLALDPRLDIGDHDETDITYTKMADDTVMIQIQEPARGSVYHLKLTLATEDGQRQFDPYILPAIGCYSFRTDLEALTVSPGTLRPSFNPAVKEYTVQVSYEVAEISIRGIPEDENAEVSGNGTKTLEVGNNRFPLTVRAENGVSIREYFVTVNRNSLISLTGRVDITKPPGMTLREITIKAYSDQERTTPISPGGVFTGPGTAANWSLSIPWVPRVYFKLTVKDSDNQTFELNTGEFIPESGIDSIDLAMTIHGISNYTHAKGVVIASKTGGVLGETITITGIPAANYVLTSMKLNGSEVSGTSSTRTFIMPDEEVSLSGEFKSVVSTLQQFTLSSGGFSFDFAAVPTLIRVPNPNITMTATPVDPSAVVTYQREGEPPQSSGTFTLMGTTNFRIIITPEAGSDYAYPYSITVELTE
jgi:hypothetical protein